MLADQLILNRLTLSCEIIHSVVRNTALMICLVFVLGHKEYYPKYGFIPDAARLGYPAPYPILEQFSDYWMVQAISPKGFDVDKGKIRCSDELNKPEHWRDDESDR